MQPRLRECRTDLSSLIISCTLIPEPRRKHVVDVAIEASSSKLPATMTGDQFKYNEATYDNVVLQYKWLVFLFFFCPNK